MGGEGPLQKLLLQLQRGPQSSSAGGVSQRLNNNNNPPIGFGLEKGQQDQQQQMNAIQSIMNQLTKIQSPATASEVSAYYLLYYTMTSPTYLFFGCAEIFVILYF